MRARPTDLRFALSLLTFALMAPAAFATSATKAVDGGSASVCAVAAKFSGTKLYHGKLLWIFDRLPGEGSRNCGVLSATFAVLIPSGSYSELSKSNVYPLSITEPKRGAEIDLRIETVKLKTGETHWMLAGDSESLRVRR